MSQPHAEPWDLAGSTPLSWAERTAPYLPELLVEQAHLEKKAAAAALGFLFRLPGGSGAQGALSRLAREELVHFERVLRLLDSRGLAFDRQRPGSYAERLKQVVSGVMPDRLLDELLVSAVIEARSCERMALLARVLVERDPEAARLYDELVAAERRHRMDYVEIALALFEPEQVAARWREVTAHEHAVLAALPWQPRLHSGMAEEATDVGAGV